MCKKSFADALMLSASRDPLRLCLCGIFVDAVGPKSAWVRFVSTDGETMLVIKAHESLETGYNTWAFENRLPLWRDLKKGMLLIPWAAQKKLGIADRYGSAERFGKDNSYPAWRSLIRVEQLNAGAQPPGWFAADTLSTLTQAKRILRGDAKANFIAKTWVSATGMHIDHVSEATMTALLVGLPLRVVRDNKADPEAWGRERFDEALKACDDCLMAA